MKKLIPLSLFSALLLFAPISFARDAKGADDPKLQNEVRNQNEQRIDRDDAQVRIRIMRLNENVEEANEDLEEKVEINGNNFEIRGEITKIDSNNFVVASQTILIDASKVKEFEQKGILKVGERVKVEGIIIDGNKFAREIKVIGNNEVAEIEIKDIIKDNVEIKGNVFEIRGEITNINSDSFVIASQTIFIDANLVKDFEQKGMLKVGEMAKVEGIIVDGKKFAREINVFTNNSQVQIEVKNATQAASAKVEVKARGILVQITDLFRQIVNFLRGLNK